LLVQMASRTVEFFGVFRITPCAAGQAGDGQSSCYG
jgi:hypothetical protein